MIRRQTTAGPVLMAAFALSLTLAGGCGEAAPPAVEPPPENTTLLEIGEMLRFYANDFKRPPRSGKDLMQYSLAFSHGSMAIQNKQVVVLGGAPLEPGSTAVIAYETKTPEQGGMVLLQDGQTIKAMTAEEFQAAPKAGK